MATKLITKEPTLLISFVLLFLFVSLFMYMWIVPSSVPTYYTTSNNNNGIDDEDYDDELSSSLCSNQSNSNNSVIKNQHKSPQEGLLLSFSTNYTRDKFTIVIPTFQRSTQLVQVLNHYCTIRHVALILVVWNNVGQKLPDKLKSFKCKVPVKFLIMKENKLTNRFKLFPEIQTEGVYAVDDDRMVNPKGMELGFNVWKAFPHLIVGFCERSHSLGHNGLYQYGGGQSYTMILTNSVFLHRHYFTMFTHSLSRKLYNFIDKNMNGEDIIMNAMVADYLRKISHNAQCPCVKVKGSTKEVHQKPEKPGGYVHLYGRRNHVKMRTKCLNEVFKEYGYMPLMPCNFTINS